MSFKPHCLPNSLVRTTWLTTWTLEQNRVWWKPCQAKNQGNQPRSGWLPWCKKSEGIWMVRFFLSYTQPFQFKLFIFLIKYVLPKIVSRLAIGRVSYGSGNLGRICNKFVLFFLPCIFVPGRFFSCFFGIPSVKSSCHWSFRKPSRKKSSFWNAYHVYIYIPCLKRTAIARSLEKSALYSKKDGQYHFREGTTCVHGS